MSDINADINTINDLSNKVCVPNKSEDLNISVFNMIEGINELKTLAKQISFEWKCKFDGRKCDSSHKWNNDKSWCERKHNNPKKTLYVQKKLYLESCYMYLQNW